MTTGEKAGATRIYNRRLNERYGFKNPVLNRDMFEDYLDVYNPQNLTRILLENPLLSDEQLANKSGKSVGIVRRFLPTAIQSVIKGKPCIGNFKLNIPELLKIRNKQRNKGVETRGRKAGRGIKTFNHNQKSLIHNRLMELLLDKKSPKVGSVATLPFNFVLEKRMIENRKLDGLMFHGYEFGILDKARKSKVQFKRQKRMLRDNKKLAGRVVMYNHDINDALLKETESDRYAHIFCDYCGMYSTNKQVIEHILQNNLVKVGGLIWITLCARAKRGDSAKKNLPKLIAKVGGKRYKAHNIMGEKLFGYSTGQHMFTTILRRLK